MNIECIQTGMFKVNTYIVPIDNEKCFIVDPASCSFCGDTDSFISFLKKTSLTPVAIVLTHGHFDHVSGLKFLREKFPNIEIYIHKDDACFIGKNSVETQKNEVEGLGIEGFLSTVSELPEATETLFDNKVLFNDWTVLHTPGHTKGSCCFYNRKEGVLLSGDTLFYRNYGRTDLIGGSEIEMIQSLACIKEKIPGSVLVYPGHDYFGFELKDGI